MSITSLDPAVPVIQSIIDVTTESLDNLRIELSRLQSDHFDARTAQEKSFLGEQISSAHRMRTVLRERLKYSQELLKTFAHTY